MKVVRFTPWLLPFLLYAACSSPEEESHGVGDGGNQGGSSNGGTSSLGGTTANGGSGLIIVQGGTTSSGGTGTMGPCTGLKCNQTTCSQGNCTQMACEGTASTTISGTVYDPAGKVPLYNVIVYVPNEPVPAFTPGAGCDRCGQNIMNPVTSALTDTHGRFSLPNAPVGENIPVVIQIGKWRRQLVVSNVPRCVDTPLPAEQTRLPRNKSEGDIPLIAITTGGADSMECLPRRMGIDDAEFTTNAGDGRIHLFAGTDVAGMGMGMGITATKTLASGEALPHADTLWSTAEALRAYDIVIFSCEGDENENMRPAGARQAVYDYSSIGGRVFTSHWHHRWISRGPDPFPATGTWRDRNNPESPTTATVNQTFPKGMALADWLVNVGASTTPGQIPIEEARDNIQAVNTMYATEWMTVVNDAERNTEAVEYMSFNTPLDVAENMKCGRVVYTDVHVSNTGMDMPGQPFPTSCEVRDLTAQEKAVEFMLFDLSSCIQDEDMPPEPPR
jgi:hypothetical protein